MSRTPNPVQKVQGYVEVGSKQITTADIPPQTVRVQEIYPFARVRVFSSGTTTDAYLYNQDGSRRANNEVSADSKGMYSFFLESGQYDVKFFDPNIPPTEEQVEVAETKKVKIESRTFNVRDFGAKGDGITDDSQSILAAIDSMIAANNGSVIHGVGTLFFPSGRYLVSRQVTGSPFIFNLPSGIIIQGTAGPYLMAAVAVSCPERIDIA